METESIVIFVAVSIAFTFGIVRLYESAYDWVAQVCYRREKKRFMAEVQSGISPAWCPKSLTYRGVWRIDPNDLVHTKAFKRQCEAIERLRIERNI